MYKLVISDDEGRTTVVPLLRDEVTIGREEGNTIRLTERNVSRSHARLLKRNGNYIVEDLGSYNGVTVNGRRIDAKAELSTGDQLGIGDYDLAFQSDVAATANTIPSPEPRSQPPPRLVVLGEPAAGAEFTLSKPQLRIGRDERLDIWINHQSISHEHAEVQIGGDKVTVFDLDSANGMRINGVSARRAVLETGDILQLGEVRFRFLPAEGAHSLVPVPEDTPDSVPSSSSSRKPIVALSVIGLLLVAAGGAVLTTLSSAPGATPASAGPEPVAEAKEQVAEASGSAARSASDTDDGAEGESILIEEPQEWERELGRARRALARGRFDRAYAIAEELPPDSVLRQTPEFGEIRYRYVQSHINDGERALREGDADRADAEAMLVLKVEGITPKQRQEARGLIRRAKAVQGRRIVD
ncbi:MAG: FHA domain-containing protein [Myxococcales bacterium]|nr:MAG: FHA domain-containing protein [Myxococcales bacterium]